MRVRILIAWFILMSPLTAQIQGRSQQPSAGGQGGQQQVVPTNSISSVQTRIDPAKEADIRQLLDLAGTKITLRIIIEQMESSIKPMLTSSLPPGEYRQKLIDLFFEKFHSKLDVKYLFDLAVPAYDRYFSHEEIKGLIQFYATPLGQKTLRTLPNLTGELQEAGRKWGEEMARQSIAEVLSEHPELAKAMEAAEKATRRK